MEREEAYKIAQQCAQFLKEQFNVQNVYIFGSVAGDGIWHKWSDIDIAVEGLPSDKYFKALAGLDTILPRGMDLDLITLENAPVKIRERVKVINSQDGYEKMRENKIDRLKRQIDDEFESMEKTAQELDEFLKQIEEEEPSGIEMGGIGSYLQSIYNGAEKIFERIAVAIDGNTPEGKDWHTLLLEQMEINTPNRPAVIDQKLVLQLLEYLRFRHLFRNIYGGDLDWNRLYPLAIGISKVLDDLKKQINDFLNQIQE